MQSQGKSDGPGGRLTILVERLLQALNPVQGFEEIVTALMWKASLDEEILALSLSWRTIKRTVLREGLLFETELL
jgi:hypothetical protein